MVNLTISTKSGLLYIHIDLSYRILEPDNTVLVYAFVSHIYKLALRIFFVAFLRRRTIHFFCVTECSEMDIRNTATRIVLPLWDCCWLLSLFAKLSPKEPVQVLAIPILFGSISLFAFERTTRNSDSKISFKEINSRIKCILYFLAFFNTIFDKTFIRYYTCSQY